MATYQMLNEVGIKEVEDFLYSNLSEKFMVDGEIYLTPEQLDSYVESVNFQIAEGNSACLEISSRHSKCGMTLLYRVSDEGISSYPIIGDDE